jgi:hypothetical protein
METNCTQRLRRWVRSRSVLRPPQGEGKPCPHLIEFKQGHDLDGNGTAASAGLEKCREP